MRGRPGNCDELPFPLCFIAEIMGDFYVCAARRITKTEPTVSSAPASEADCSQTRNPGEDAAFGLMWPPAQKLA